MILLLLLLWWISVWWVSVWWVAAGWVAAGWVAVAWRRYAGFDGSRGVLVVVGGLGWFGGGAAHFCCGLGKWLGAVGGYLN